MAVIWPTFISSVGEYLNDSSEGKSHDETAEKIASEYHNAVKAATTSLHMNGVMVQAPYTPIKMAIERVFDDIRNSEGNPQLIHFMDWATQISTYWLSATMNPMPFHPINMTTSTGTAGVPIPISHIINNGGVIPALQSDLLNAFTHTSVNQPYGIPFATKLSTAFINHLSMVGGLQTATVIPGTPTTPGPPFPLPSMWLGMV